MNSIAFRLAAGRKRYIWLMTYIAKADFGTVTYLFIIVFALALQIKQLITRKIYTHRVFRK